MYTHFLEQQPAPHLISSHRASKLRDLLTAVTMKTEDLADTSHLACCDSLDYASPSLHIIAGSRSTAYAEFFVHQSLIDSRSALVARSLRDLPSEPKDRKITLPDCEPEVVSQYIKLLYTGKLLHKDSDADVSTAPDGYLILCKLYILAETLVDQSTRTTVLDELYVRFQKQDDNGMHDQPSLLTIQTIYGGTKDDSRAREWLVDLYTTSIGNEAPLNLFPIAKDFPQPFLADLFTRTITFCPLPTQVKTLKHEVVEARAQAQAHLNAKLQLGGHFAKKEVQLKEKLAKTEEQYKGACRGISTLQNTRDEAQRAKTALEENLQKARDDKATLVEELRTAKAEVDMLKRRSQSTGTVSSWDRPAPDVYRNR